MTTNNTTNESEKPTQNIETEENVQSTATEEQVTDEEKTSDADKLAAAEEEIATLRKTMEEHNYTVDYIITHCAPTTVLPALNPYFEQDEMTQLLDEVYYSMDFKYWYFGHYHLHRPAKRKTFCLYNKVIEVEE